MATGDGTEGVDIIRLTQNGQNLYTQGKISDAVKEFQKAYYYALKLNHTRTVETCAYNLACAYAADQNGKDALKYLKTLSQNFMDTVDKGELTFLYGLAEQYNIHNTKTVRIIEHYRNALEQLNRLQSNMHASLKKYILEQLCVCEMRDNVKMVEYLHQLADVYAYLKMPFRRLQLLCDRANLLFKIRQQREAFQAAEDCLVLIKELQGEKVTHLVGDDGELRETTEHCLEIADIQDTSNHLVPLLNDIGLLFTQLQDPDKALECFRKARQMLGDGDAGKDAKRNDSVLLQNIGAVYNFKIVHNQEDIPEALNYHTLALKEYSKQKNAKSQGHCYLNKAFAQSLRKDLSGAQEAYILALHKAEEKKDLRTQWQALEGLAAVACNNRDGRKAQEYLHQALKLVHQDEQDPTQVAACDRILEKLLIVNRGKGFGRSSKSGLESMVAGIGSGSQKRGNSSQRSRASDMDVTDRKLSKEQIRQLKVRRDGSLRLFPKVAQGLATDTQSYSDEDNGAMTSDTMTLSSDSSSSSEEESGDSAAARNRKKGQSSRPTTTVHKGDSSTTVRQTITPRMSMRRPDFQAPKSDISRRQSQKGLKTSLLMTFSDEEEYDEDDEDTHEDEEDEEEDEKEAVMNAYRQIRHGDSSDEDTARTPRKRQSLKHPHKKPDSDVDGSIEEKADDHIDADKIRPKKRHARPMSSAPLTSAVKREGTGLSSTKSLRFQSPDTSDEEEEDRLVSNKSEIKVDVHQPQRSTPSDHRPKSRLTSSQKTGSESEFVSDSESATLSEEDVDVARQAPRLPTYSPPVTPSNTYEIPAAAEPVMMENTVYEDMSRNSTGHYAEIDFGNTSSSRQQGEVASAMMAISRKMHQGPNFFHSSDENEARHPQSEMRKTASEKSGVRETTRSFGESTVYETIQPPDSTRSDMVTSDSARSAGQQGDTGHSREYSSSSDSQSEGETERGLSRTEREHRMFRYHQQHQQEQEEEAQQLQQQQQQQQQQQDTKGKSRTCVIS